MLAEQKLDFHLTFRHLTRFRPALLSSSDTFIDSLLKFTSAAAGVSERDAASKQWRSWLEKYAARIESEEDIWVGEESEGRLASPAREGGSSRESPLCLEAVGAGGGDCES
jgi:uncharacterized protein YdiU (UPF0061 family)